MTDDEAFDAWLASREGRAAFDAALGFDEPEGETVEVRVAVAINTEGEWSACGQCDMEDADAARIAVFDLSAEWRSVPYILVARLPIPREPELIVVDAKVEARE